MSLHLRFDFRPISVSYMLPQTLFGIVIYDECRKLSDFTQRVEEARALVGLADVWFSL